MCVNCEYVLNLIIFNQMISINQSRREFPISIKLNSSHIYVKIFVHLSGDEGRKNGKEEEENHILYIHKNVRHSINSTPYKSLLYIILNRKINIVDFGQAFCCHFSFLMIELNRNQSIFMFIFSITHV